MSARNLQTLSDLKYEKQRLNKKLRKCERRLGDKVDVLKDSLQAGKLLDHALDQIGMESDLLSSLLPLVIKYRETIFNNPIVKKLRNSKYKKAITVGTGLAVGFGLYKLFKSRKNFLSSLRKFIYIPDLGDD